jgi:hypothetical protein
LSRHGGASTQEPEATEVSPIIAAPTSPEGYTGRAAARSAALAEHWKEQAMFMFKQAKDIEKKRLEDPVMLSAVLSCNDPIHDATWHKKPRTDSRVSVQPHEVTGSLLAVDLGGMLEKKLDDDVNGKVAAAQKTLSLAAAWQRCSGGCVCGQTPCPIAGLRRCDLCHKIQIRACGKRACVAERERLAAVPAAAIPQPAIPVPMVVGTETAPAAPLSPVRPGSNSPAPSPPSARS